MTVNLEVRLFRVCAPVFALFMPLIALAQSSTDMSGPFSSGAASQSGTPAQSDISIPQQNNQDQTQVGPRSLSQSQQTVQRDAQQQQQDRTQTERNGRFPVMNPLEPVSLTAFQRLVAASVGKVLPVFGANLFTNVPTTFSPVDRIPVTPDYVIGPGDELLIRIWGQVTLDGHFTVDRSGNVYIPQVGAVRVAGVPFAQITDFLRSQVGHNFRNFDINVNIGQLRSIQVFIVGEAKRPGSYTISSLSTLVNALFASGGPSPMGSLRKIQVKRGSETVTTFDFYDLLLKGDKSKDVQLVSGDVIFIPPVGPVVALAGSVDVPALYEVTPGSTVKDVISLAGGLSTLAQDKQVHVERIKHHDDRSILDVTLDPSGLATVLSDGDILEVSPIIDRFTDAVTLRGNVADPRRFAWVSGMRIKDVIPNKDALLTRDYWQQRNRLGLPVLDSTPDVRRYAPDAPYAQINGVGVAPVKSPSLLTGPSALDSDTNVYGNTPLAGGNANAAPFGGNTPFIRPRASSGSATSNASASNSSESQDLSALGDSPENSSNPDGAADASIDSRGQRNGALSSQDSRAGTSNSSASGTSVSASVTGAARRFPVKNTLVLSAPEVDWAYAVVERLNRKDLTTQLLPFNLGRVVLDGDNTQNLELEPGDVVTIFSKADIRVPQVQQTKYVRLEGEFAASGTYSVGPGETLRQLVARVGLSSNAYLYGSQFTRESTRVLQQQRLNDYAADLDRRIRLAEANAANNTLSPQDAISDIAALQTARTVAARLRQLNATGRIVLNISPESKGVEDLPDLPLEDGDAFVVPQLPSSIDVFGSVYTQTSFVYDSHKRAGDYLRQAGGGTRTADNKRSYIVRADGSIISRQFSTTLFSGNFDATRLYPGDALIVPESVDRRPLLRNLVDIATIVGQFGLGIAAINVLK
jgi:polysaccharide export outer membrane protein